MNTFFHFRPESPLIPAVETRSAKLTLDPSSESDSDYDEYFLEPPERSRFTSGNFLKASQIIRSIKNPTKDDRRPVFWNDDERILTYELIVAVLKHSPFLTDALEKSSFYISHPHLQKECREEILVVLYDLIERDFRTSQEDCPLPEKFAKLQSAILSSKTKLMAHIAKLRIKHEATSLENLLPSNIRSRNTIDRNPLYVWVNLKKVSVEEVTLILKSQGLRSTYFEDDTLIQENLFCLSTLHPELLRLHSSKTNSITNTKMFKDGLIVVQDRSSCLPVYVLAKALYYKEALNHRGAGMEYLNPFPNGMLRMTKPLDPTQTEEWYHDILDGRGKLFAKPESIIVTHCGSGRTAAHLAILLSEAVPRYLSRSRDMSTSGSDLAKSINGKFLYRPPLNILVFGTPKDKYEEIQKYLRKTLGINNIKLYCDDFVNVHPKDARIKGCGAILVNPPSSGSGLKDPAAYICSEGGDEQVLSQYSKFMTSAVAQDDNGNLIPYSPTQAKYLTHALNIPNVKLILYTTCSNLQCENAEVIRYCVGEAKRKEEARKCQHYASIVLHSQSKPYREVSFETIRIAQLMEGYEGDLCFEGDFVNMQPSSACNGVFFALVRRKDKQVLMAKSAVKQFVATHMRNWTRADEDDLEEILTRQASAVPSSGTVPDNFSEDVLSEYLIRKLSAVKPELQQNNKSNGDFVTLSSPLPTFPAQVKKKLSKRAIVKRVSIPTHSSLQRMQGKFMRPDSASSLITSGLVSPRSIGTPISQRDRCGTAGSEASSRGYQSNIVSASQSKSNDNHKHSHIKCLAHNPAYTGHVCVCARHARKFPEMLNNL